MALEHVNVTVPDQRLATLFYVVGLGFTRDPYLSVATRTCGSIWAAANPHADPCAAVLRGHVGIVVPDLAALEARLAMVREKLAGTRFAYARQGDFIAATSPWGNELRCYAPAPGFGSMVLGMPYVEFTVPQGTADGIARFYQQVFRVAARTENGSACASVPVGPGQTLRFRETAAPIPDYDGHHVAIYIADFSGPHRFLAKRSASPRKATATSTGSGRCAILTTERRCSRSSTKCAASRTRFGPPLRQSQSTADTRTYVPWRDAFCGETGHARGPCGRRAVFPRAVRTDRRDPDPDRRAPFLRDAWERPEGGVGSRSTSRTAAVRTRRGQFFACSWRAVAAGRLDRAPCRRPFVPGDGRVAGAASTQSFVPTVQFNVRLLVAERTEPNRMVVRRRHGSHAVLRVFGDAVHFPRVPRRAGAVRRRHLRAAYKKMCDDYFYLKHRRGRAARRNLFRRSLRAGV